MKAGNIMRKVFLTAAVLGIAALASADSLFNEVVEKNGTLISDKHASFKEGDILTVLVRETIDASTEADTNTKKDASVQADAPAAANPFLIADTPGGLNIIPEEVLPNWDIGIENEHKSTGKTTRANKLVTTISCIVTKVHDNGNIDIEGQKRVTVNREDSNLLVKGTVRSRDVSPGNTVLSTQVANVTIELKGKGPLWNNSRRGIITKVLDWFSPF
jgi:flagellar L-ring protein precursor FlgH